MNKPKGGRPQKRANDNLNTEVTKIIGRVLVSGGYIDCRGVNGRDGQIRAGPPCRFGGDMANCFA
jgi:hypothetical protein